jgi:hypothetical protein
MGRPSVYSIKLGKRICDMIAEGASLRSIGEMPAMPSRRTMRGWLETHVEFERSYEIARKRRAENLIDEIVELSDSVAGSDSAAAVNAARLAVATRQWVAAKLLPQYGDKSRVELSGKDGKELIRDPPDRSIVALALLSILRGNEPPPDPVRVAIPPPASPRILLGQIAPEPPAEPELPELPELPALDRAGVVDLEEQRRQLHFDRERGILSKYPRR